MRESSAHLCVSPFKLLGTFHTKAAYVAPCFESTSCSSELMRDWLRLHAAARQCLFACLIKEAELLFASTVTSASGFGGLLLNAAA